MKRTPVMAFALVIAMAALGSPGFGEIYWNSFDAPARATFGVPHVVNDLYLDSSPDNWLSGGIYVQLDAGKVFLNPFLMPGDPRSWLCLPGVNSYDSWYAPGAVLFADADYLGWSVGFSDGRTVLSHTFVVDDPAMLNEGVPWDRIQMRLVLPAASMGRLAFRVGTFDSSGAFEETLYTAGITNGRVDWEQPIPGDLTFDGLVNEADLALVKANWGAAYPDNPIILGDLGSGDPSHDGAVNSVDLDILRANWTPTPPAAAVPEPGILVLLGLPLALAGLGRRAGAARETENPGEPNPGEPPTGAARNSLERNTHNRWSLITRKSPKGATQGHPRCPCRPLDPDFNALGGSLGSRLGLQPATSLDLYGNPRPLRGWSFNRPPRALCMGSRPILERSVARHSRAGYFGGGE